MRPGPRLILGNAMPSGLMGRALFSAISLVLSSVMLKKSAFQRVERIRSPLLGSSRA
jgi:hypothetical protein